MKSSFYKATVLLAVISLCSTPLSSQAWFFPAASAQTTPGSFFPETEDYAGVQTMEILSPRVAMISDRKAVDPDMEIRIADNEALDPDMGSMGTLADMVDIPTTSTISTYVVQSGDSVSDVAKRFGVSENTVRWANNMDKKDVLHKGETLVILPITGVKHKVVKGDTIQGIAKKYKGDAKEIADYNNMYESDILSIGDVIIIPDGEVQITKVVVDKKTGKKQTVSVIGTGLKGGVSSSRGYFIRPITTADSSSMRKTQGFHDHYNAVDIGAPQGTNIHAMADGTVIATKSPSGWNGGYGGLTIISHSNGSQTLYAHQSKIDVSVGQKVTQGQVIGEVGHTGSVSGPTGNHLHFEIRGIYPTPVLY